MLPFYTGFLHLQWHNPLFQVHYFFYEVKNYKVQQSSNSFVCFSNNACEHEPELCRDDVLPEIQTQGAQRGTKGTHGKTSLSGFEPLHCHLTWNQQGTETDVWTLLNKFSGEKSEGESSWVSSEASALTCWWQRRCFTYYCWGVGSKMFSGVLVIVVVKHCISGTKLVKLGDQK